MALEERLESPIRVLFAVRGFRSLNLRSAFVRYGEGEKILRQLVVESCFQCYLCRNLVMVMVRELLGELLIGTLVQLDTWKSFAFLMLFSSLTAIAISRRKLRYPPNLRGYPLILMTRRHVGALARLC